ncbi:MAG: transporter [Betaproteobacteria bacterium]
MPRLCVTTAVCLLAAHAMADDAIVTDRPDVVESSVTVGKGHFQLETSIAGAHNANGTMREDTLNTPTLLRYGFAADWELRLASDGYTRLHSADSSVPSDEKHYGMADMAIGVKWHVADRAGLKPSVAWLLHADLPSGAESLRGHAVRPSLRASLEWDLPGDSSIGVMPGVIYDSRDDGHRFTAGIFGVSFGHAWNDRLHSFLEVAATQIASPANGGNLVTYDVGFSYLLTPMMQVDAGAFIGANQHTPDIAWTVGFSVKF